MNDFKFAISVETDDRTGELLAAYFQIRKGRARETKEYADGLVFADYDREGKLLGIEMLGPCEISVLDKISRNSRIKQFVKESMPHGMIAV